MIGSGMALNLNGKWEVDQIFPHLTNIVNKCPEKFNGEPVVDSLKIDEDVKESEDDAWTQ